MTLLRPRGVGIRIVDVNRDRPLRLTVEIDSAAPLTGRIGAPGAPMHPFSGWLGLATRLELFVGGGPGPQPAKDQEKPPRSPSD